MLGTRSSKATLKISESDPDVTIVSFTFSKEATSLALIPFFLTGLCFVLIFIFKTLAWLKRHLGLWNWGQDFVAEIRDPDSKETIYPDPNKYPNPKDAAESFNGTKKIEFLKLNEEKFYFSVRPLGKKIFVFINQIFISGDGRDLEDRKEYNKTFLAKNKSELYPRQQTYAFNFDVLYNKANGIQLCILKNLDKQAKPFYFDLELNRENHKLARIFSAGLNFKNEHCLCGLEIFSWVIFLTTLLALATLVFWGSYRFWEIPYLKYCGIFLVGSFSFLARVAKLEKGWRDVLKLFALVAVFNDLIEFFFKVFGKK